MQEDVVEPLGPDRCGGTAIVRVLAHAHRPLAHVTRAAHDGQFQADRQRAKPTDRKFVTASSPSPVIALTSATGVCQFARQRQHVDGAVLLVQFVGHVQQHQRRQAERDHASGQHQVACAGCWSSVPR